MPLSVTDDTPLLLTCNQNYDPVVCYIQAMQAANFTPQTTVYVASGIFLTMNATGGLGGAGVWTCVWGRLGWWRVRGCYHAS